MVPMADLAVTGGVINVYEAAKIAVNPARWLGS